MLFRTLVALLISTAGAFAQLTWGVNGAGGTGTWDTTTQDWFNGTNNVAWDGNIANFAGTSGNITISGTVSANQVTFNTAGYNIISGTLQGPTSGTLSIITNSNAIINAGITTSISGTGSVLLKDGVGTLSLGSGVGNFSQVQINNGDLDLLSGSSLAFLPVNLSNVAQASLTFDTPLGDVGNLSGGGSLGGNVLPDSGAGAVTFVIDGGIGVTSGSYAGSLQDNGASILSVKMNSSLTQTLTGVNTYSGATQVTNGILTFSGGGTAAQTSSISVTSGGTLILDNSATAVGNRLSDTAPITVQAASFAFLGNSAAPTSETMGALTVGAGSVSKFTITPDPAQPSSVTFASIAQANASNLAGVLFRGSNLGAAPAAGTANIYFSTTPTLVGGGGGPGTTTQSILPYGLGDFSTTGNGTSFVTYGANGIRPLADNEYADDSFAVTGANVNLDAPNALATSATVNALRLQDGGSVAGAGTLTVSSGAVLGLPGTTSISTAQLAFGANPIIFQIQGTTTVASALTGTSTAGLDKFGNGQLILSGSNNYTGPTRIIGGVLNIQNSSALGGTASGTTISGGAALAMQGSISVGSETLTVNGYGGSSGQFGSTGALHSISGTNTWQGNVTVNDGSIGVDTGSLTLSGTVTVTGVSTGLTKVGNGTLNVANAIPTTSLPITVGGGWLISNATSGNPFGTTVSLLDGGLGVAPSGTGNPSVTMSTALSYTGDAALGVNKAGATSATLTIEPPVTRTAMGSTLLIVPADGIAALGVSEKLVVSSSGVTGNIDSIVDPSIMGQNNDTNQSGDFLTNSGINGLKVATYSPSTNLNSVVGNGLFQANAAQTLTNNQTIVGLKDNGQVIDLGANQLQVENGVTQGQSGVILNGGTIQNGQLAFLLDEGIIYTSLAGGTISAQVTGSEGVTTFGPGKLTLSGTNTYTGNTTVNSGNLNLAGSITSAVSLAPGAILSGTGQTTMTIAGGLISPGTQVGILTANKVAAQLTSGSSASNPYTNFAFEFDQTGLPNFSSATASGNDVLHLTAKSGGFMGALTASNTVDLYFNISLGVQFGQTYMGGFYSDDNAAFDSSIVNATYDVFVSDPLGATTFDGNTYSSYTGGSIEVSTVPETANFGSGNVNGYVMEVQIVPEPANWLTLACGAAVLGLLRRNRRFR